jgi:cytoskeletal protein CcmA (bactofilin family)
MWKRDQAARQETAQPVPPAAVSPQVAAPLPSHVTPPIATVEPHQTGRRSETNMVNIGKSVVIKGDLHGSEDLTIEGQVEGMIQLNDHVLTVGPNGRINAQVFAKTIIVLGTVHGNVTASEKIEIREGASVTGDVAAPRVAIAEGGQFNGSVDMRKDVKRPQQVSSPSTVGSKPPLATPMVERVEVAAGASAH